jgi:hypothetical protein
MRTRYQYIEIRKLEINTVNMNGNNISLMGGEINLREY